MWRGSHSFGHILKVALCHGFKFSWLAWPWRSSLNPKVPSSYSGPILSASTSHERCLWRQAHNLLCEWNYWLATDKHLFLGRQQLGSDWPRGCRHCVWAKKDRLRWVTCNWQDLGWCLTLLFHQFKDMASLCLWWIQTRVAWNRSLPQNCFHTSQSWISLRRARHWSGLWWYSHSCHQLWRQSPCDWIKLFGLIRSWPYSKQVCLRKNKRALKHSTCRGKLTLNSHWLWRQILQMGPRRQRNLFGSSENCFTQTRFHRLGLHRKRFWPCQK